MSSTITVRQRAGRLWITIPAAIRRGFGLQAGDTARWRKQPGENACIITFFRRGRRLMERLP